MRLVQLRVPEARADAVTATLRDEDVEYVRQQAGDGSSVVVEFPVPTQAVDRILADLREVGLGEDDYTVVLNAQTAVTPTMSALEDRYIGGSDESEGVAREEIRSEALTLTPGWVPYYAMTLLSAAVAASGLLLDSPALVVGSMVIAPQVGSALTASVGLVLDDASMMRNGFQAQLLGLALAVVAAAGFGWALQATQFVTPTLDVATISQIRKRVAPGLLSVTVGVAAGAAGALGLATAVPVSLVGVMIAAALIPAAAAVGIGLAWGLPGVAAGAAALLAVNAVAINVAAVVTFWAMGYRPADWRGLGSVREHPAALVVVGLLSVAAVGAGVPIGDHIAFSNDTNAAVQDVLDRPAYDDVGLVQTSAGFRFGAAGEEASTVTVEVAHPAGETYPDLAAALAERIAATTGSAVRVVVTTDEQRTADVADDEQRTAEGG